MCLFVFIVIGCTTHQGFDSLDTSERGEPHNASTYDAGLDTFDDESLKRTAHTKVLEKAGWEQHHFGQNRAINLSPSGSSNRAVIYPTAQKPGYNMYSQRAQDSDDDDDDDDDYDDDDGYYYHGDHRHPDDDHDHYHDDNYDDHHHHDDDHHYDHDHDDDHDDDHHHHYDNDHHHGHGNRAPVTVGTIPNQTVNVRANATVNIRGYFSDPEGDALTYAATSSDTTKATVSASSPTLTITGIAAGTATITVTATDPGSLTITQQFTVIVNNPGNTGSEIQPSLKADVNADGVVDIMDLLLVALQLGVVRHDQCRYKHRWYR